MVVDVSEHGTDCCAVASGDLRDCCCIHLHEDDQSDCLWSCGCGWTNTAGDAACQRCGTGQVDGYGFRI